MLKHLIGVGVTVKDVHVIFSVSARVSCAHPAVLVLWRIPITHHISLETTNSPTFLGYPNYLQCA